jgi:hypothetical protein
MNEGIISAMKRADDEGEAVSLFSCFVIDNGIGANGAAELLKVVESEFGDSIQSRGAAYAFPTLQATLIDFGIV